MQKRHSSLFVLTVLISVFAQPATSAPFPHTPESRPVPGVGMSGTEVLANYGQPTSGLVVEGGGNTGLGVWEFGTFRVFLHGGQVVLSRRW